MIVLLLTLLTLNVTDAIHPSLSIQIINTNNGYAIIKTKEKPIIESYLKVLHLFNLTEIEQSASNIKQAIDIIDKKRHNTILTLITEEYSNLINNIQAVKPHSRQKRGLINLAGKISKYIYGTMDNDDATEIYAHLSNLDNNIKNVIAATNEQVEINNNLLKITAEIKNHTNTQTKAVRGYLHDMEIMTNRIEKTEENTRQAFELYLLIEKLNKLVTKFSDIILLSRLNILAHDIFSREEAEKYNITTETLPFINTNIMFEKNLIIFVLKIPRFTEIKFYEALIIPFPNVKKEELESPITKIIINNNEIYEFNDKTIKRKYLKSIENECIRNILIKNDKCNYKINREQSIAQLDNHMIITKNLNQEKIIHNCTDENVYLEGNNVINFHLCNIRIKNLTFINENAIYVNTIVIPQINLNTTKIIKNITLETLNFETIKNRKTIEYIEFKQNIQNNATFTLVASTIIIILIIIIFFIKRTKKESTTKIELTNYIDPFGREEK